MLFFVLGLNTNKFILGKHSGRHAFRAHLEAMGHTLTDNELNQAFSKFKEVSDKKKTVSEADIESIVSEVFNAYGDQQYKLVHIQVLCGDLQVPTATACVRDEVNNVEKTSASIGNGPFDAAINAVKLSMDIPDSIKLSEYSASSVSEGKRGIKE
jgi:2-isopropylmalate synthase